LARKPIPIRSKNDLIGQDSLTMAGWLTRLSGGPMVLLKNAAEGTMSSAAPQFLSFFDQGLVNLTAKKRIVKLAQPSPSSLITSGGGRASMGIKRKHRLFRRCFHYSQSA